MCASRPPTLLSFLVEILLRFRSSLLLSFEGSKTASSRAWGCYPGNVLPSGLRKGFVNRRTKIFCKALFVVAAVSSFSSTPTAAQFVKASDISHACSASLDSLASVDADTRAVVEICGLRIGEDRGWSSRYSATSRARLLGMAQASRAATVEPEPRSTIVNVENVPQNTQESSSSSGASSVSEKTSLSQADILFGVTDFIVGETEAQVRSWLLPRVFKNICEAVADRETLYWAFPQTCGVLARNANVGLGTSARTIKEAVENDINGFPIAVLLQIHTRLGQFGVGLETSITALNDSINNGLFNVARPRDSLVGAVNSLMKSRDANIRHLDIVKLVTALGDVVSHVAEEPVSIGQMFVSKLAALDTLGFRISTIRRSAAGLVRVANLLTDILDVVEADSLGGDRTEWTNALRALVANGILPPLDDSGAVDLLTRLTEVRGHLVSAERHYSALQVGAMGVGHGDRAERYVRLLSSVVSAFRAATNSSSGSDSLVQSAMNAVAQGVIGVETGNYAKAVSGLATFLVGMDSVFGLLPTDGVRVLTFAADLAQATTSHDVKRALDGFANAAGGRATKRADNRGALLGLQAYGGVQVGGELADRGDGGAPFGGLYAPVGFEVTFPANWGVVGNAGLFVQIIDVGVLASARLFTRDSADVVGDNPNVGFRHVVAPGLFLTYAFPKTPLSMGVGVSRAPGLRDLRTCEIAEAGAASNCEVVGGAGMPVPGRLDFNEVGVYRFGGFLAVDIPIFP